MQQLPETEVAGKSAERYKLRYSIMRMQEEYARNVTAATRYKLRYSIMRMQEEYARNVTAATIRKMYVLRVKNVTAATIRKMYVLRVKNKICLNCLMYLIIHEVIFFILLKIKFTIFRGIKSFSH